METTAASLIDWSREDIGAKLAISKPSLLPLQNKEEKAFTVSNFSSIGIFSLVKILLIPGKTRGFILSSLQPSLGVRTCG